MRTKTNKIEKWLIATFLFSLLLSFVVPSKSQRAITQNKQKLDSLALAVVRKSDKPSYGLDSTQKNLNIKYILSLSDFDTIRLDSNKVILVPKQLKLLHELPPVKKK